MNKELDQAVAQGYRFAFGEPASRILVLEKRSGDSRKYLVNDRLPQLIKDGSYKGYRILPRSFSSSKYAFGADLSVLRNKGISCEDAEKDDH